MEEMEHYRADVRIIFVKNPHFYMHIYAYIQLYAYFSFII